MRQWGQETPLRTGKKLQKGLGFSKLFDAKASSKMYFKTLCLPYRASPAQAGRKPIAEVYQSRERFLRHLKPTTPLLNTEITREDKSPFCYCWTIHWRWQERGLYVLLVPMPVHTCLSLRGNTNYMILMRGDGTCTSSKDFRN